MKTSQPGHKESVTTIQAVLNAYLAGESRQNALKSHPEATGFINRSYDWLGAVSELSNVQRKMLDRMLLTIEFFAKYSPTTVDTLAAMEESEQQDMQAMMDDWCHDKDGRGAALDAEIADEAGLPKIYAQYDPAYQETLDKLEDGQKKELYKTCCAIASGVQSLSDSSVDIRIFFKTLPDRQWTVARELRRRIKNRFDEEGIEIPFPHRTLYIGTGEQGALR